VANDSRVRSPNGVDLSQEAPGGGHACCFGNHGQARCFRRKRTAWLFEGCEGPQCRSETSGLKTWKFCCLGAVVGAAVDRLGTRKGAALSVSRADEPWMMTCR
jgi:hypothetical protein